MVCMFSHWTEAFLADGPLLLLWLQFGRGNLLEKIIPTVGNHLELYTDRGTHFTGQMLQQVCAVCLVL